MFERFSDAARQVIVLAQEEARRLNHHYIGTEHILLGLLRDDESGATRALQELGITLEAVRQQVEEIVGRGKKMPSGHIPFTPRAKKVLELSLREALHLGHNYIGPEHILLGLLREGDGVAVQALVGLGADLNRVRLHVIQLFGQEGETGDIPVAERVTGEAARSPQPVNPGSWLAEVQVALANVQVAVAEIADRLTAIERHLGMTTRPAESGDPPGREPDDSAGGSKATGN
jgi:ATP-dependent Clp protease ATP-binding subunit ClpC